MGTPILNQIIRDLSRYKITDFGSAKGIYDTLAKNKWGGLGDYVTGGYSVHHSAPTPKNLTSIIEKGLEARPGPGGQPPLLFSWNTLNDAGLLPERRSWGGVLPPRMADRSNEVLAFLLKNNADTSMSRGGVPGSLTTRKTVSPEDFRIVDPLSFGGRKMNKSLLSRIPPEMMIKLDSIIADDILEQLFAQGIQR